MSNKLQVLFVTDGIFPHTVGGIQKHSKLLVEALAKSNQLDLIVIHPHIDVQVFDEELNVKEEVVSPPKPTTQYIIDCFRYSVKVARVINKYPKAVIYSQGFSVWSHCSKFKKRLIINPHGLEAFQTLNRKQYYLTLPFRWINNYLFKRCAYVVSLGGHLTNIIEQRKAKDNKVIVLPNATNIKESQKKIFNNNKTQILFVGRFAFNKGIDILLDCVQQFNNENLGINFHFNLVGKGPLFENFKSSYKSENLTFHGFASDEELENLYETNHLFVLPTLFEGMPTVVLEAMSHRMPIIVTDVGATREMVDEKNGYIIEKGSVSDLHDTILKFHELSDSEKNKLSETSYTRLRDNFTWSVIAKKHIELFNKISIEINA